MVKRLRKLPFARSRTSLLILVLGVGALILLITGREHFQSLPSLKSGLDSEQIRRTGHRLYNADCMRCHGVEARGTSFGPPLTHPAYHEDNLSDQDFVQAVLYGAPEHRWTFGPMEPVEGLKQVEIAQILAYVRSVQNRAKND